ncbi:MAG TPA: hypothetical protein VJ650_08450 [Gemmatimonadaceae bacterium]|nr:hypothetical protein [Gemmatimonadaceae bacterium]
MRLTDDEMRDVFARAEEIQAAAVRGEGASRELEAVIQAGEEVGLTRSAIELALRERLDLLAKPPAAGDLVFAKSADGKFYIARVLAASSDAIRVQFLRGGEHTLALSDLRPCSFVPGSRVVCPWPWWGPWTCTVLSYDADKQRIKVTDGWGETRVFPIADVWLDSARRPEETSARTKLYITLLGSGVGIGTLIGSLLTALLGR